MKKAYVYDEDTREFIRIEDAYREPKGGKYVHSTNSTFIKPMENEDIPSHTAQIFDEDEQCWELVSDYRGMYAINTRTHLLSVIDTLGELPPETVLIPDEMRDEYTQSPEHFVISANNILVRRTDEEIEQLALSKQQDRARQKRNAALNDIDWRIQRAEDAQTLGITAGDKLTDLVSYRQYLRDFTELDDWWNTPIPSFEEFLEEKHGD